MIKSAYIKQPTSPAKGLIYLTLSKFFFIISGYGIYFGLTRLLGPERFGIYSVVISLISVFNTVLITGTIQAVSKFVSEEPKFAEAVKNEALKIQFILGGSIFIIYFLSANLIALFFKDPCLTFYFRLSSPIIIFYSFYAAFVGYFNGLKHFKKQAFLDMTFSTIKLILILTFVYLGYSVTGAITGFISAAFIILLISALLGRFEPTNLSFQAKKIFHFEALIMIFTLIIALLMNVDLFLVKALSPLKVANSNAGYYTAALTIARVPYQAIISLTYVLFPLISRATFVSDKTKTTSYISNAFRYSYILLFGLVVLISSNSKQIISLLYTDRYLAGSQPLSILTFGLLFFSLFIISANIISASGRPQISLRFGIITLLTAIGLNYLLIPKLHLVGAALATTFTLLGGLLICLSYIKRRFGVIMPGRSFLKISICGIVIYLISFSFEASRLFLLLKLAALAILYFLLLSFIKELKKEDIQRFKNAFGFSIN